MDPVLTLSDTMDEATRVAIGQSLMQHNIEKAGYWDSRPLVVLVSDPATGKIVGGLRGHTSLGLFFIDTLTLPAELRGKGTGSRMLRLAEDEARRRGCRNAVLYTISFRAPGFYERNGYREFGRVACDPPGTFRHFFSKSLE
jgi:GNAT superfamily N-acetyltransferase